MHNTSKTANPAALKVAGRATSTGISGPSLTYIAVAPPSTGKKIPVMNDASSEARNKAA